MTNWVWGIGFGLAVTTLFIAFFGFNWERDALPVTPTLTPAVPLGPPVSLQEPTSVPTAVLPMPDALPYVDSAGWDVCAVDWDCWRASKVQRCENPNGDPYFISDTGDYGIMQINAFTWDEWLNERGFDFWGEWFIAQRNVEMAYAIWREYWWYEWACFAAG